MRALHVTLTIGVYAFPRVQFSLNSGGVDSGIEHSSLRVARVNLNLESEEYKPLLPTIVIKHFVSILITNTLDWGQSTLTLRASYVLHVHLCSLSTNLKCILVNFDSHDISIRAS